MKILKKCVLSALLLGGAVSLSFSLDATAIAQSLGNGSLSATLNNGMDDFATELGIAVPQAAVQQNVYAEAFIGKVFPSVPPHFAVGIDAGFTHLNTEGLAQAANALGIKGVNDDLYFPVLNADLRVGGVFLPFDVGISFMTLDVSKLNSMDSDANFTAEFFTLALDARYAIIEDGLITPAVSVGVGYSINKGTFGASNDDAEATVDYDVQTLYGQVQVSKTLNIPVVKIGFTPFVGLRGVLSKYSNDWSWKYKGAFASQIESVSGVTGVKTYGDGTASNDGFSEVLPQLYGGLGFNFMFAQLTASVCADLRHIGTDSKLWSGAVSLRFKL